MTKKKRDWCEWVGVLTHTINIIIRGMVRGNEYR